MSTSYSPALEREPKPEVHSFPYAEAERGESRSGVAKGIDATAGSGAEQARREEAAREAGRVEGEARARANFDDQVSRMRAGLRTGIDDFAGERAQYYRQVEAEIVRLALNIARKILHREAQLDPLLLAGLVRVALDQIKSKTKTIVRVHPQRAAHWREFFAQGMDPSEVPEVVDDPALDLERCVLQTELGTTELGIEVQLKEIEHGLFDLLAQRPETGA